MSIKDILSNYCTKYNLTYTYENAGSSYWDCPYKERIVVNDVTYNEDYCFRTRIEPENHITGIVLGKLLELQTENNNFQTENNIQTEKHK